MTARFDFELSSEVRRISQSTQRDTNPWYLLPETGFSVKTQIDQLIRDIENARAHGKTPLEALGQNFCKIEQDIQAFKIEYLCEGLVFPIVLKRQNDEIVCPLYNNKPLVETVTDIERGGAVKKSAAKVAEFLKTASPGSVAILTSPDGWTGMSGITYEDSQTYIWQVREDESLRGFTIRTDMTLEQNRNLLASLGKDLKQPACVHESIIDVVSRPVFLHHRPGQNQWQTEDVVNIIRQVKDSNFAYKNRTFDEIYQTLQNPDHLWTLDEQTKNLTEDLKAYMLEQIQKPGFSRKNLEIALGLTVLKLASLIRPQTNAGNRVKPCKGPLTAGFNPEQFNYAAILEDVQQLSGCNGGGGSKKRKVVHSLGPRFAGESMGLDFPCPACGTMIPGGLGITECPNESCRLTKEEAGSLCA